MLNVRVDNKSFPNTGRVIDGLEFNVQRGEFLTLFGPSGSGKSTLLNLIAGLDKDFKGMVDPDPSSAIGPRMGYVFQDARLMPWMTVFENVQLVAEKSVTDREVDELLDRLGLSGCRNHYPKQLSGGMQRKVALSRALIARPKLLLMDEPFISLDFQTAEGLRRILLELWEEQNLTVVFVTHDLQEAVTLSDRIISLSRCPARLDVEKHIDLPRPRRFESTEVASLCTQLRQEYQYSTTV